MSKYVKIIIVVIVCLLVGYLSSFVTKEGVITWYPTLKKPFFNPPNWIFAPVWSVLYVCIGIAGGLVWRELDTDKELVKKALFFFVAQLLLNAMWSYLFFGLHNILLALIEIILLWLIIYETYLLFKKINKTAAFLFIPYLVWVAFATILTISIYILNF